MPIPNSLRRLRRTHKSDSKEDGCTVIAVVFTWSLSEPRSQARLRLSRYCGTRVHGKGSHRAPLLSLRIYPLISLRWALGRYSFECRPFLRSIEFSIEHTLRNICVESYSIEP